MRHRPLRIEQLETRRLLAGVDSFSTNQHHNAAMPEDVDDNKSVTPLDALLVINDLNANGPRELLSSEGEEASDGPTFFLDVNNDGILAPIDALHVINVLNAQLQNNPYNLVCAGVSPELTKCDVRDLLHRAAAASASEDAIIAVVDRNGRILGVRTEQGVLDTIADEATRVFAIDGAVAKARTAAFFAHNQAPLTSRTVRFISQSTITERDVNSNPNVLDPDSPERGPGTVAPIGLGGHFPPGVLNTPPVDLFDIEHTNRDSLLHPGVDGIKGTLDDRTLDQRFNLDDVPIGKELYAPESYGYVTGKLEDSQARGIATLPGGIPIYKDVGSGNNMVGGIGVFFPGSDGYASFEQAFQPTPAGASSQVIFDQEKSRLNAPKVLEAEWMAVAAVALTEVFDGVDRPDGVNVLRDGRDRLDLVGITLETIGPHPTTDRPQKGIDTILDVGDQVGRESGIGADTLQVVNKVDDKLLDGLPVPDGWLVEPKGSGGLSESDVIEIIEDAIDAANEVRAAIRLPIGSRAKMVFAVADEEGEIIGLYRMEDATVFSIGVAVAKARNTAYYAGPVADVDQVDDNDDGVPDIPKNIAFTNRTFRFLAEPRFPSGVDGSVPGDFSPLRDALEKGPDDEIVALCEPDGILVSPSIDRCIDVRTGETERVWVKDPNTDEIEFKPVLIPSASFQTVVGYNRHNPGRNFRYDTGNCDGEGDDINQIPSPNDRACYNQNGIVFFPGSTPLYSDEFLVGGFGVSGDGVDQDDVVTVDASHGFQAPLDVRADNFWVRGVQLPYQKFLRNPLG